MVCMTNKGSGIPTKSTSGSLEEAHTPLQARWGSRPEPSEEETPLRTEESRTAEEVGESESHDADSVPSAPDKEAVPVHERVPPSPESLIRPGMVEDLRQLANSLLAVARALEELDAVLHRNHTATGPESSSPTMPTKLSDVVNRTKGRPDLQEMLRQYLFR
jgi:hypothetical protein